MLKKVLVVGLLWACAAHVMADYVADRDAAMKLVWAGKHEEALAAFARMAASAKSDVQKSDALAQAVLCAISLKKV